MMPDSSQDQSWLTVEESMRPLVSCRCAQGLSVIGLSLLAACGQAPQRSASTLRLAGVGTQASCDSAVAALPALRTHNGQFRKVGEIPLSDMLLRPQTGMLDAATGRVWELDRATPGVVGVSLVGEAPVRWGRRGSGPGDIATMPISRVGRSIAPMGSKVLVVDAYRLQLFDTDGRPRALVALSGNPLALSPGLSVRRLTDTSALLGIVQSRLERDTSFLARTTNRFLLVRLVGDSLEVDSLSLTLASRFRYAGGLNRTGQPLYNLFVMAQMGETWGVSGGALTALSFSGYGVCTIDPATGAASGLYRLDLARRPTTDAERIAAHERFPGIDDKLPSGESWGEEMDGAWPSHVPWYLHLVTGDDILAAARSVSPTQEAVDLVRKGQYVGSAITDTRWLLNVIAIEGDSLLRLEEGDSDKDPTLAWYRLGPSRPSPN